MNASGNSQTQILDGADMGKKTEYDFYLLEQLWVFIPGLQYFIRFL